MTLIIAQGVRFTQHRGQLRNVRRDPARLILRQQLGRRPSPRLILVIDVSELLSVSVPHDVVVRLWFGGPRCGEATWGGGHVLSFVETEHVLDGIHDGRFAVLIAI